MHKHNIFVAFIFLSLLISCSEQQDMGSPMVSEGYLDLSEISPDSMGEIKLDGQWEFYWNRLLSPEDFKTVNLSGSRELIDVPGNWSGINNYPSHGYATLRMEISSLNQETNYSLYIPEMLCSFIFYINGKIVFQNGLVGTNADQSVPHFMPGTISFNTTTGTVEIVCQISNFNHRNSGIWRSVRLGTDNKVHSGRENKLLLEMFISAILLTISLFHIGIYFYRYEAKDELLFGLTCLVLFFRTITTGEQILNIVIPSFPWEIARKLEYSPFFLVAPLFMTFLSSLFPDDYIKNINRFFLSLFAILGMFFILFPVKITNNAVLAAEIILVICILYAFFILIRALIRKRDYSKTILAAFTILAAASLNDILFSRQIIQTMYLSSPGFIIFIFIQSQMLSLRFATSFQKVQGLSLQLKGINDSLSRFVPFQFLEYLKKNSILDVNLGDQVLENMTILFADIRSFTSLSEKMSPEENFKFLNSFLSQVVPVIRENGGFVDKFIGDGVMALFPFPPDKAVHAAIELQKAVDKYNEARNRAGYRQISLGIGIHTGQLMLGTIGETNRMETTVIADAVNIASRLENLTKTYDSKIIISKELFSKLENREGIKSRSLGESSVKGKSKPIEIVEILIGDTRNIDLLKIENMDLFESAIDFLKKDDYYKAAELFREILDKNPEDRAAALFHKHCIDCELEDR